MEEINMEVILFIVVSFIGIGTLYSLKQMKKISLKKEKKEKERTFKTFRVIESKGRYIWYEESKFKVI